MWSVHKQDKHKKIQNMNMKTSSKGKNLQFVFQKEAFKKTSDCEKTKPEKLEFQRQPGPVLT